MCAGGQRCTRLVMRAATGQLWAGEELPAELFRAGFALADGSKATWPGPSGGAVPTATRPDERPKGPVLLAGAGGGGSRRWPQDLWLWPLPPEGRLQFVCEWPALDIDLTRAELNSKRIREAADRSQTLLLKMSKGARVVREPVLRGQAAARGHDEGRTGCARSPRA
jgi:hypothetical protein